MGVRKAVYENKKCGGNLLTVIFLFARVYIFSFTYLLKKVSKKRHKLGQKLKIKIIRNVPNFSVVQKEQKSGMEN